MDISSVFETERLFLRPLTMDDLPAVFERTGDPEVMRFHNCGALSLEATQAGLMATIARARDSQPFGLRAVIVKASNRNVGFASLAPLVQLQSPSVEISYDIVRACWGNGYATEATARLVQHAFEDLNLAEIVALVHPKNVASARVAEKLGLSVREKIEWPEQGLVDLYTVTREMYLSRAQVDPGSKGTV